MRAAIRLHVQQRANAIPFESWAAFKDLQSHVEEWKREGGENWLNLNLMAKAADAYAQGNVGLDAMLETFCKVSVSKLIIISITLAYIASQILTNSLTLVTPTYDPIGLCMDPLPALMNHSCDSNAVVSFDGSQLHVRSLRKIERDEEITISYVDSTNPFRRRQQELKERYFFECQCSSCREGPTLHQDLLLSGHCPSDDLFRIEEEAFSLNEHAKGQSPLNASVSLEEGMKLLKGTGVWPTTRQPYQALRQQYSVALISSQSWIAALQHLVKVYFQIDPILFPETFHPVRIVHTWTLALLLLHISGLPSSETADLRSLDEDGLDLGRVLWVLLKEIEANVDKSHGESSRFAVIVRQKANQVKADMRRAGFELPSTRPESVERILNSLRPLAKTEL